jgi:hypothetical protein
MFAKWDRNHCLEKDYCELSLNEADIQRLGCSGRHYVIEANPHALAGFTH